MLMWCFSLYVSGMLTELDAVLGPLSLTSSMTSVVRYTRQGVDWLRQDSRTGNWATLWMCATTQSCSSIELLVFHFTRSLTHLVVKGRHRCHLPSACVRASVYVCATLIIALFFFSLHGCFFVSQALWWMLVPSVVMHTFHVLHLLCTFLLHCQLMSRRKFKKVKKNKSTNLLRWLYLIHHLGVVQGLSQISFYSHISAINVTIMIGTTPKNQKHLNHCSKACLDSSRHTFWSLILFFSFALKD